MVDDGQTIALGGLIDEVQRDSEQRVPLLGDLPLLGALFRYNKSEKIKTNLMVFLRPTIIRDANLAVSVAGGKYNYMRNQQLQSREQRRSLLPREVTPVLPEWQQRVKPAPTPKQEQPASDDGDYYWGNH